MGPGIFRYAASLPAQTAECMSRHLAGNSASKRRRVWLRSLLAADVAVAFASTALAEKRVALIVANGAYKGAPLENPTVDADFVAASLTNIGFVVKVMKNVDLDEFGHGVTEFAREANGVDVALFEPMPRETIANSAPPDPFRR
jgi:Caspase domain